MLVGTYEFTLDAKARVAIPARLRSAFVDGIYVTTSPDRCLAGYTAESFDAVVEEAASEASLKSRKGRDTLRFVTANAVFGELDGQGRIKLAPHLLEYAGITKDVAIIGVRDRIEIWDRTAWEQHLRRREEERDDIADEPATA